MRAAYLHRIHGDMRRHNLSSLPICKMLSRLNKGPRVNKEVRYLHPKPKPSAALSLEGFGDHVFRGQIAAPYLKKHGLSPDTLTTPDWATDGRANQVRVVPLLRCSCSALFQSLRPLFCAMDTRPRPLLLFFPCRDPIV